MKIDATYADAEMRYLVDVDIIHDGCRKVTDYIIKVCEAFGLCKLHINFKKSVKSIFGSSANPRNGAR